MDYLPKLPHDQHLVISNEALNTLLTQASPKNPSRNFLWTSDCNIELPIRIKKQGPGSQKPITVCQMFQNTVLNHGLSAALNYENHQKSNWTTINYLKYYELCKTFAKALITLQISERATINIIGFNSAEWAISYFGSILGNYIPVGLYFTNGTDMCQHIALHSQCQIVILQNLQQLTKYIPICQKLTKVKYYVMYKGAVPKNLPASLNGKVISWKSLMNIGYNQYSPAQLDKIQDRMQKQKPGNCCTFIYTSGTTGVPKAVMISHDNYTWVAATVSHKLKLDVDQGNGRILSFLPLSHVASQICDLITPLKLGFGVFFADKSVLKRSLVRYLKIAKPYYFY